MNGLDSLGALIKDPVLGLLFSLQGVQVGIASIRLNASPHWHFGSDVEWLVDLKAKVFIHTTCSERLDISSVENCPLLVFLLYVLGGKSNTMTFFISGILDTKDSLLVPSIGELLILVFEELPPLAAGAVHSNFLALSIARDVPRFVI